MERRSKIILGLLVAVLVGIIVTEIVRPKPINWKPSYTAASKIPFGCFVLFNELSAIFPNTEIKIIEESVYTVLTKRDSTKFSNYLIINDILSFDTQESIQLLNYVAKGNQVFIAANEIYGVLADTLNLKIEHYYDFAEDTAHVSLSNKRFKGETFEFERGTNPAYFTSVDTAQSTILGHISFKDKSFFDTAKPTTLKKPNFIKTKFGKGNFLINTLPIGLTNYYMLGTSNGYSVNIFSYLNNNLLYWDDYKKSGRMVIDSPMRFVLNQPALAWAYYLTISGLLLFVIFKAKREQRIIPVNHPLDNSSVEFARTIGSLYHQNKDYTNLNSKKINFFLSYIRGKYYLNTAVLDEKLIAQLAAKSGAYIKETKIIIEFILSLKNKPLHTEQETIALSDKINTFKKSYGK